MDALNEAIAARRSERMLREFGLNQMVSEPIHRELQTSDRWPYHFVPIEREALKVIGTMWKERTDR